MKLVNEVYKWKYNYLLSFIKNVGQIFPSMITFIYIACIIGSSSWLPRSIDRCLFCENNWQCVTLSSYTNDFTCIFQVVSHHQVLPFVNCGTFFYILLRSPLYSTIVPFCVRSTIRYCWIELRRYAYSLIGALIIWIIIFWTYAMITICLLFFSNGNWVETPERCFQAIVNN